MKTDELDYHLPEELIAQQALAERTQARLLVLDRETGALEHRRFFETVDYLGAGDCLVLNDSRVIPARFFARRQSGGKIEGLFLHLTENGAWQVLLKNASRVKVDETLYLEPVDSRETTKTQVGLTVLERQERGGWVLQVESEAHYLEILRDYGVTPLPPYIRRGQNDLSENYDRRRYQTVYAGEPGSVAAPTAGLHFDEKLLEKIEACGVKIARVHLHVGLGTFEPVVAEVIEDHPMHSEAYQLDRADADIINQTIENGGRIIAVGTTSVRTLETCAEGNQVKSGFGETNLLITPGYTFKVVDALITNFHLPRTTLLALVCAWGGTERVLAAYRQAIQEKYRFYSYGDAMFIL